MFNCRYEQGTIFVGETILSYDKIENIVVATLDMLATKKYKYLRGNHQPFMNKEQSKAIMTRSRLKNVYLRNPSDMNRTNYTKQRNYCVNLRRRVKMFTLETQVI